jgi:hypothetical protein
VNLKTRIVYIVAIATLSACAQSQSATSVENKPVPTKNAVNALSAPTTKAASTAPASDAVLRSSAVKEVLVDDLHLEPVRMHNCGSSAYEPDGPSCGGGNRYGSTCCGKGEICVSGKFNADATAEGQFCCPEGTKWCPGGHGIDGGCIRPPKVCTGESPGTVR